MSNVTSKDGTKIAYETKGQGKPVILVDGALCYRSFGPMGKLSDLLAPNFKVFIYDRRGRGESSDTKPSSVQKEVEDLEALIDAAGGSAYVFGTSSGACLALEAAVKLGKKIEKLALYEPPYNPDPAIVQQWKDYWENLSDAVAEERNGDAVTYFMQLVGTPDDQVNGMRQSPMWGMFEAVAPTLPYDAAAMGENRDFSKDRVAKVVSSTLVMSGTALPFMQETATRLCKAIPGARQKTLEGQTHDVDLEILAPVLIDFFNK